MKLGHTSAALEDLDEIIDYLENQSAKRAQAFIDDYRKAITRIKDFPRAWPKVRRRIRVKIVSRRFQYGIYYELTKSGITVGAVLHLARRPSHWKRRFKT